MEPTVFHVTHVKSGSQWVYQILNECAPARIVKPRVKVAQFYEDAIAPGMIYPTVYAPRDRFESTLWPRSKPEADSPAAQNWRNFVEQKSPVKTFVVIRDLRDTLVSLYFSLKVSHAIISDNVSREHRQLGEMNFEDGLLHLFGPTNGQLIAKMQSSWMEPCRNGEALLLHYEDIIMDDFTQFQKIIDHCEIPVSRNQLREVVERNSFAARAGRQPGEEDQSSHFRKGIAGDWKNRFTEKITAEFKRQFGQALIDTGYETDLAW